MGETQITASRAREGAKGALPPPPPFSGEQNKGAKNHTHRTKKIKIGQPRSKIAPGGYEIARVDDFDMPEHHSHGP